MTNEKKLLYADDLFQVLRNDYNINGANLARVKRHIDATPAVDAVERKKYEALREMYNDLRENFVDFVCSGVPNVAPYCLNRCDGCCDAYGWCRQSDRCRGFNPAEVIVDGGNDNG